MGFFRQGGGDYEIVPEAKNRPVVCVDAVDMGIQPTKFGDKPQVMFVFACEEKLDDGKLAGQHMLLFRTMTNTTSEHGALFDFMRCWSGEALSQDDLAEIEPDALIGQPASVDVEHSDAGGRTFANLAEIAPWTGDDPPWFADAVSAYERPDKITQRAAEGAKRDKVLNDEATGAAPVRRKFGNRS